MKNNRLISVGEVAPDFKAVASDGSQVHLAQYKNRRNVLLVLYPGDNTPICTAQLCEVRDEWSALIALDTVAFGINPASKESHQQFSGKNRLPFPLIVDEGGEIASLYGCKAFFGMRRRAVVLVGKHGRILFAETGKPPVNKILAVLRQAQDSAE